MNNPIQFKINRYLAGLLLSSLAILSEAKGLYFTNAEFLGMAFKQQPYQQAMLWLSGERKQTLQQIFDRKSVSLRQRYWYRGNYSAWIFNEIGKELPITIGVVVHNDQIEQLHVLEYRESRGGEIRHDFFTQQFLQLSIDKQQRLSQHIDGITGATLSVTSMKRVAQAALYLHQQVLKEISTQ